MINHLVIDRCAELEQKPTLSLIPQGSLQEFWLPLTAFCTDSFAKNGCKDLSLASVFFPALLSICCIP